MCATCTRKEKRDEIQIKKTDDVLQSAFKCYMKSFKQIVLVTKTEERHHHTTEHLEFKADIRSFSAEQQQVLISLL